MEQPYFATNADNLSGTLINQLEAFMKRYGDTGQIVIDSLQRIRDANNDRNSYGRNSCFPT